MHDMREGCIPGQEGIATCCSVGNKLQDGWNEVEVPARVLLEDSHDGQHSRDDETKDVHIQ